MTAVVISMGATSKSQLFTLSLEGPHEPLKSGAELRLHVTVKNTSDRTIGFVRSPGPVPEEAFRYEIEVRDATGRSAPPSTYLRELKNKTTIISGSNLAHWLKAGESFVDEVDITKLYDLTKPGKYTVAVARDIPPNQNLGQGKVKSNPIIVTVIE